MSNSKELIGTKKTDTRKFCLENKLTTANYEKKTIKTPPKIPSNIKMFCSNAKLLNLLNKFVVNIKKQTFRPNQHLLNKGIKQTINSRRIVLIGYWRYGTG